MRRKAKVVKIGNVKIGGEFSVAIQGMVKTNTCDIAKTVTQIKELHNSGAAIVRLAIEDFDQAEAFKKIRKKISKIPLVTDIHFDYRLAIKALNYGADKIRLNPGNINKPKEIEEIAKLSKKLKKPIRVGLNSGSIDKIKKGNKVNSMVRAGLDYIRMLERFDFNDIVLSAKSSDIKETLEVNQILAKQTNCPIHLGVTATGPGEPALIKSSIGIGSLLLKGIGDTIRVSLTASAFDEIEAAKNILQSLNLGAYSVDFISCPTCGRCKVNLGRLIENIQKRLQTKGLLRYNNKIPYKVAVMGCVVNGPGEAKEANLGIAFSKTRAVIFKNGRIIKSENLNSARQFFFNLLARDLKCMKN